jgi:hypothetical protein
MGRKRSSALLGPGRRRKPSVALTHGNATHTPAHHSVRSAGRGDGSSAGRDVERYAGVEPTGEVSRLGVRSALKDLFQVGRQLLDFGPQRLRLGRIAPG